MHEWDLIRRFTSICFSKPHMSFFVDFFIHVPSPDYNVIQAVLYPHLMPTFFISYCTCRRNGVSPVTPFNTQLRTS